MDRNLGAERVAKHITDDPSFGNIYRWNSATAYPGNSIDTPEPWDTSVWGDDAINLKPGVLDKKEVKWSDDGWEAKNSPCPAGFSIPTKAEWEAEKILNAADAFSKLRLPMAMFRYREGYEAGRGWTQRSDGSYAPEVGYYWSRTTFGDVAFYDLNFTEKRADLGFVTTAYGLSMRCIKNRWSLFGF
ncbi:hypothetical protein RAS12_08995 [Achromobacter seleniivolatilans]|uniref:Fibrobacter succinogenes major paralogous domain-containing protein n=1 Tax=Achromobacter seleniivolatilans TaxID=3047478 RepID=A0ABY9M744_9BURK|nr:FISUMP domain-containing protein [Achromobacter sp. R39]WMD22497.1 hypothetical protein RAS12_08995 [Achromobacter sp. R39]